MFGRTNLQRIGRRAQSAGLHSRGVFDTGTSNAQTRNVTAALTARIPVEVRSGTQGPFATRIHFLGIIGKNVRFAPLRCVKRTVSWLASRRTVIPRVNVKDREKQSGQVRLPLKTGSGNPAASCRFPSESYGKPLVLTSSGLPPASRVQCTFRGDVARGSWYPLRARRSMSSHSRT
jgi:hypothetical protein